MPRISVQLLGPPGIRVDDIDRYLPWQKSLGLLFLLLARPGQAWSRGRLVALLWEESAEREGRNSLSVALSRLRQGLPALPIVVEGNTLACAAYPDLWVDTWALQAALDDGRRTALETGEPLWRGPFLDGFGVRDSVAFEEWLRQERDVWQARALDLFTRLADAYDADGDWPSAVRVARQALSIDPLQEHIHRALMRVLARSGDRAAALAHFRVCQELLRVELGASPDSETVALAETIARGGLPRPAQPQPIPPQPSPARMPQPALPLIGRDDVLERILGWLAQGRRTDMGHLIIVQGETGIGKSRLVEEVLVRLDSMSDVPWRVLVGHSYEAERSLPYRAIVDALATVTAHLDLTTLGLSDQWLREVSRLLPDLAVLGTGGPLAPLDSAPEQFRLFEGVTRFMVALGSPLLLALEDLHWADEATLQLLAFILRHASAAHIVLLATVRTEDVGSDLATLVRSLERERRVQAVQLERLSQSDTTALLQSMVSTPVHLLGERLHAETEGNPLFAVEMVRSLLEQGALLPELTSGEGRLQLPDSVQAVIASRLDRLDDTARSVLNAAAIFRRGATFDQVQAVSGLADEPALDALDSLLQARLLREAVDRARPSAEALYLFAHSRIQQVVDEGLNAARRRLLHRRAVDVVTTAEERAYHATQGHLWEQALPWCITAAGEATQVSGYAAATRLYQQALHCLAQLPSSSERRRQEIDVRLALASVGFYVQPGALTDWLAPAMVAARELADDELVMRIGLMQAGALYIQGRFSEALPLLDQLASAPLLMERPDLQARHANTLGRLLMLRGELRRACAELDHALALMEGRSTPLEFLVTTNMLASAHAYLGDFARALVLAKSTVERAASLADPSIRGVCLAFLAVISTTHGDWSAAEQHARQAIALARDSSNSIYEYVGYVFLAPALMRLGEVDEAIATLRHALDMAERSGFSVLVSRAHAWLAAALVVADQPEAGLAAAQTGQTIANTHGWPLEGALCDRSAAAAHAALGDWSAAEMAITASIDTLERLEAVPDLARSEAVRCQIGLASGNLALAAAAGRRAADLFNALQMTNDLADLPHLTTSAN